MLLATCMTLGARCPAEVPLLMVCIAYCVQPRETVRWWSTGRPSVWLLSVVPCRRLAVPGHRLDACWGSAVPSGRDWIVCIVACLGNGCRQLLLMLVPL